MIVQTPTFPRWTGRRAHEGCWASLIKVSIQFQQMSPLKIFIICKTEIIFDNAATQHFANLIWHCCTVISIQFLRSHIQVNCDRIVILISCFNMIKLYFYMTISLKIQENVFQRPRLKKFCQFMPQGLPTETLSKIVRTTHHSLVLLYINYACSVSCYF